MPIFHWFDLSSIKYRADPTTIRDKFLVGYQGWYVDSSITQTAADPFFTGIHAQETANPLAQTIMAGCTGSTNPSPQADALTPIYGPTYHPTLPLNSSPPLDSNPNQGIKHFCFLHDTQRPSRGMYPQFFWFKSLMML